MEGAERVQSIVADLKASPGGRKRIQAGRPHECLGSAINIAWNEIKYKATLKKEFGQIREPAASPTR